MLPIDALKMRSANLPYFEGGGILGNNTNGPGIYNTAPDEHGGFLFTVPAGGVWVKTWHISIYSVTAGMKVKPVIWNCANGTTVQSTDTLLKVGQEFVFPATIGAGGNVEYSVNINSDGSAYFLPAGTYSIGYHSNATFQVNSDNRAGAGPTWFNGSDTYSDGVAATFGSATGTTKKTYMWMPYSVGGP